jgi:hypothetical protein
MKENGNKKLLFSVSVEADCDIQTFRAGGKGGQHQNKTETGVRLVHRASGAVGEAREERSQHTNKKLAFRKLIAADKFKRWHRLEVSRLLGRPSIEELVDELMKDPNIKIEVRNENGNWQEVGSDYFTIEGRAELHTYIRDHTYWK